MPKSAKKDWPVPAVSKLEAVWLDGPVPWGYWQEPRNRRRYMHWLGQRLRYKTLDDWYKLTARDFYRNRGGGLFASHWSCSPAAAVKECFSNHEWYEWLFGQAPLGFWRNPKNHRRYIDWLARQLGIERPEDWYQVTGDDIERHKGAMFLIVHNSSPATAIMACLPDYPWKEWLFSGVPHGFWETRRNRCRYMAWLGEQLGYKTIEDWYKVTKYEFYGNAGIQFLKRFDGSPIEAVKDYLPKYPWLEWLFARVPSHFWDDRRNRRRYLNWLGEQLGFQQPRDWLRVRHEDFQAHHGSGLLNGRRTYRDVLREYLPKLDWSARVDRRPIDSLPRQRRA